MQAVLCTPWRRPEPNRHDEQELGRARQCCEPRRRAMRDQCRGGSGCRSGLQGGSCDEEVQRIGHGPDTADGRFWGWSEELQSPSRMYAPMQGYSQFHSLSEKKFLGATVPAQTRADPSASLKTAMDTLAAHPNVGPFIGRQLIQRLVTSNPSPAYIARVAATFCFAVLHCASNSRGLPTNWLDAAGIAPQAWSSPAAGPVPRRAGSSRRPPR